MAFNDEPTKTNDPSYLGVSQGTDRASQRPLAQVPELNVRVVTPDYKSNKSLGQLFGDVAQVGTQAVNAVDGLIKQKIDDELYRGIDKIRDEFGVAQAVDLASGTAKAVGAAGNPDLIPGEGGKLPPAINRLGNRIEGLTQAYNQGELSNSYYYSRIEQYVREVRNQYPGYREQIDQKVSQITGTTPANAVRSSLLQDVTNLQNKLATANDKWDTWERSNSGVIQAVFPGYFEQKAQGKQFDRNQVLAGVARWNADEAIIDRNIKSLNLDDKNLDATGRKAEMVFAQAAATDVNRQMLSMTNAFGINSMEGLQKYMNDVRSGSKPLPTPEEKQQLTGILDTLERQADIAIEKRLNTPLHEHTTVTLRQFIKDGSKIEALKEQAKAPLKSIRSGFIDGQTGLLALDANMAKAVNESAETSILRQNPAVARLGAVRKQVGHETLAFLLNDTGKKSDYLVALQSIDLGGIITGQQTARGALDVLKNEGVGDPTAHKDVITLRQKIVMNPDKFSEEQRVLAVKSLVGPGNETLLGAWAKNRQAQVFTDMVSPMFTAQVAELAKKNPQVLEWYKEFARRGFADVFQTEAANANEISMAKSKNSNIKLEFDEKSNQFRFIPQGIIPDPLIRGMLVQSNARLMPLNRAINSMQPVWALDKADPMKEIQYLLGATGIVSTSPIGQALMAKIVDEEANSQTPSK